MKALAFNPCGPSSREQFSVVCSLRDPTMSVSNIGKGDTKIAYLGENVPPRF